MMPGPGGDVNTTLPLILAILSIFPCCNIFFGIPALILAILAMNAKKAGNLEDARSKSKISIIISVVGWVLSIISIIIRVVMDL